MSLAILEAVAAGLALALAGRMHRRRAETALIRHRLAWIRWEQQMADRA
jgi:hypothetical protein